MTHDKWIKLTPEKQRIKIAELCGYRWLADVHTTINYAFLNDAEEMSRVPDYLNDLNAMHEVENTMPEHKWNIYDDILETIVDAGFIWNATAAERAEAFVLTMEPE